MAKHVVGPHSRRLRRIGDMADGVLAHAFVMIFPICRIMPCNGVGVILWRLFLNIGCGVNRVELFESFESTGLSRS